MINVEEFIRPKTLEEALNLLQNQGAVILAGGTGLSKLKDPSFKTVVDLSDMEELQKITISDKYIEFGSMVTMTQITKNANLPQALIKAAKSVSSTPIRNMTTVGGEIARGVYWIDFVVMLLAFDAQIELRSANSARKVKLSDIYKNHPSKFINKDEMIVSVYIKNQNWNADFVKFAKTSNDYAIINVGVAGVLENGTIKNLHIGLGAVVPLSIQFDNVDLLGKTPSSELFDEVASKISENIKYRSDFRASKDYQKHLTKTLIARVLKQAFYLN